MPDYKKRIVNSILQNKLETKEQNLDMAKLNPLYLLNGDVPRFIRVATRV